MGGNINNRPIGKCSICGGIVSIPSVYMSVNKPIPRCENCGAVEKSIDLPIIEMQPIIIDKYPQSNIPITGKSKGKV